MVFVGGDRKTLKGFVALYGDFFDSDEVLVASFADFVVAVYDSLVGYHFLDSGHLLFDLKILIKIITF